jgi:hypothetical protein
MMNVFLPLLFSSASSILRPQLLSLIIITIVIVNAWVSTLSPRLEGSRGRSDMEHSQQ